MEQNTISEYTVEQVKNDIQNQLYYFNRLSNEKKKASLSYLDGLCDGVNKINNSVGLECWKYYLKEYVNRVGNKCLRGILELENSFPFNEDSPSYAFTDFYKYDFLIIRDMESIFTPFMIEMTESHTHNIQTNNWVLIKPYKEAIYFGWDGNEWLMWSNYELAQEFINSRLPAIQKDKYANVEIVMPSIQDMWNELDDDVRNKLNYTEFTSTVGYELSTCIQYSANAEKPRIYFSLPSKGSTQIIIDFSVYDQKIEKREEYNWHCQNMSQTLYSGAVVISVDAVDEQTGKYRISTHH